VSAGVRPGVRQHADGFGRGWCTRRGEHRVPPAPQMTDTEGAVLILSGCVVESSGCFGGP